MKSLANLIFVFGSIFLIANSQVFNFDFLYIELEAIGLPCEESKAKTIETSVIFDC